MKQYINSKILKIKNSKNSQAAYIDVCSEIMEQYDNGKISSSEALEVIKDCLKNITNIKIFSSSLSQLWRNKLSTIATILTVAIVTLLIVLTSTVKSAAIDKQVNWINNSGADIFVATQGTMDIASNSYMSLEELEKIRQIPGVESAQGFIYYFSNAIGKDNKYLTLTIQSYDPESGFGGPWKLAEGRSIQDSGEAVLDDSLRKELGKEVGESITLAGHSYKIVGFSKETQAFSKQSVFISNKDALQYLTKYPYYHFVLVKSTESSNSTVTSLENLGYNALTRQEFADNTLKYWNREVAPTMDLITTVSICLGFVVLTLLFVLSSGTRKREISIMKSVGASNKKIAAIEAISLGISTTSGVSIGMVMAFLGIIMINQHSVGLEAKLSDNSYVVAVILILVISLISILPITLFTNKTKPLIAQRKLFGITFLSLQE